MDVEAYENVLNRIYLSLMTNASDILLAVKSEEYETLERLFMYSEVNVNKLSDYCLRLLNIQGFENPAESNVNYLMTSLLEEVGDDYADIARAVHKTGKKPTPAVVKLIEEVNALLEENYKSFLQPAKEKLIEFHEKRNALKKRMTGNDEIMFLLRSVLDKLMEVNNCLTTVGSMEKNGIKGRAQQMH